MLNIYVGSNRFIYVFMFYSSNKRQDIYVCIYIEDIPVLLDTYPQEY